MVPMRDGTKLATEVLRPSSGGPAFPVILVRTVYGRKNDGIARKAKELGIAVVSQDTRGYGDSEGEKMQFAADGAGKLRDGDDTVSWIKSQPWCNGKVGTWGSSALGITQVLLAPVRNDLACQMIVVAPSSMYPVFMRGGIPQKLLPERYARMVGHEKWFLQERRQASHLRRQLATARCRQPASRALPRRLFMSEAGSTSILKGRSTVLRRDSTSAARARGGIKSWSSVLGSMP